ncbi:MAG: 2-oxoacid:ferredoxin oxidoreductase subunit beta [Alkalispirochaeta sp.]
MKSLEYYLRGRFLPHIWCPGCGHGTVLNGLIRSIDEIGLSKNEIVMVSGIGCSARITGYVDFHTLHTLHGRALAFATGVKLNRPELTIIVPMGDGDGLAIGGNHFIHAARRNIDITVLIMNNRIYGMTGGQFSPMSGCGVDATTAPFSTIDPSFDIVDLARSAGATFVARTTTFHVHELQQLITRAIRHKGFSVVEVMSQCPTHFGRRNRAGEAAEMLTYYKEYTARVGSKALEENSDLVPRGVFVEESRPEYCERYAEIVAAAQSGKAARAGTEASPDPGTQQAEATQHPEPEETAPTERDR